MATKKRLTKLKCKDCGRVNYYSNKPKALKEEKLSLKKFCRWCKKHIEHKEKKK